MGRKRGQGHKPKQAVQTKNQATLLKEVQEINECVDKLLRISTIPQQPNVTKSLENQREISLITDKLIQLQRNENTYPTQNPQSQTHERDRATGATIDALMNWMRANGAEIKGCSIAEFEGFDLGVKADTDIPTSSLVIAVPRKLMITLKAAAKRDLKSLMEKDQILKNMPNVALAIYLLVEKYKENSFWKPYLDILPKKYTTVLYFTIEELEELKGSPTLENALRLVKSIARQYAYFYKLFNASDDSVSRLIREKFTYSEYCWAVSTVMTRQNTIPSEDRTTFINGLIPLWDMCNHTNGLITTEYNPELDRSECLALRDFKAGEQFFIFYGARTNADLFVHNGFVYEDNVHDGYWIRLGISKSDPLQEKRRALLKRLGISSSDEFFIKKGPQPIDGNLLAFLRIFNMNEDQLRHWTDGDRSGDLQYVECALDTALEKKSWCFLQARLRLLLGMYKTPLEDDLALLKESRLTANGLLAVRMRATEKKILKDTLDYVDQYIKQ